MEHAQQQSKARRGRLLLGFALESVKAFGWDRRSGYCGNPLGASFGSVPLCPSSRSGRKVTRSSVRREAHGATLQFQKHHVYQMEALCFSKTFVLLARNVQTNDRIW
jgi:hypothetical protein